jgi:hypothetical protein
MRHRDQVLSADLLERGEVQQNGVELALYWRQYSIGGSTATFLIFRSYAGIEKRRYTLEEEHRNADR